MNKNKFSIRVLAEIAIFAAIAFVLDALQGGLAKVMTPFLVNGGSIGIAMVPIIIISYRRGLLPGILCGFIVSFVQMLGGVYAVNGATLNGAFLQAVGPFIQIMLDYVLAYTLCGFAGAFAGMYHKSTTLKKKMIWIISGTALAGLLKYACHVLAGLLFWPGEIWGISGSAYAFAYNGVFCIPNIILSIIIMVIITRFYPTFIEQDIKKEVTE